MVDLEALIKSIGEHPVSADHDPNCSQCKQHVELAAKARQEGQIPEVLQEKK